MILYYLSQIIRNIMFVTVALFIAVHWFHRAIIINYNGAFFFLIVIIIHAHFSTHYDYHLANQTRI